MVDSPEGLIIQRSCHGPLRGEVRAAAPEQAGEAIHYTSAKNFEAGLRLRYTETPFAVLTGTGT